MRALWVSNMRMKQFLRCFSILVICLVVQACSANDATEVREEAWKAKLSEFQPIGKSREELLKWQNENGVPLNSFPREEGIILETVKGDGWVCSIWHIYLSIEIDEQAKISGYSVSSVGSCI
jgi:hypothetical protein